MRSKWYVFFVAAGCFLGALAAKADEVGFVDCANHPDNTQVLAKAAKTDEVVASLPCGERFAILQGSFFFSKIQTKDGKVGFILTNSISRDYSVSAVPQAMPPLAPAKAARSGNPFSSIAAALKPKQQQGLRLPPEASAASAVTPAPTPESKASSATAAPVPSSSAPVSASQPAPTATATVAVSPAETKPGTAQPAANDASASALFPAKTQIVVQGETSGAATPQAKPADTPAVAAVTASVPAAAQATVPAPVRGVTIQGDLKDTQTAGVSAAPANFPDKTAVVVQPESSATAEPAASVPLQPDPSAVAQPESAAVRPEPEPAQPPTPAFHRSAWEKPRRDTRSVPLIELFGGFAFARLDNGAGSYSNVNGALGSFGWNAKPWLQVVGDTSYNTITTNGVKSVLYGNHYGPRVFWRRRGRWGIAPFFEGLIGGSRADTTVSGAGGYKTSQNCISYKVGGGLDLKPSRYVEIRVLNVDYYRTSFGTNLTQTNYWASAGIVLRLFGGGSE